MYEVHRIDAYTDLSVDVTVRSGVKETRGSTGDGGNRNTLKIYLYPWFFQ